MFVLLIAPHAWRTVSAGEDVEGARIFGLHAVPGPLSRLRGMP